MARLGTRRGRIWHGVAVARLGKPWQGRSRRGKAWLGSERGLDGLGKVGPGTAWRGELRLGEARQGKATWVRR